MSRTHGQLRYTLRSGTRAVACVTNHRAAFTLLELLVVVGIIALLLAFVLPALSAARRQTRRVQCQTNLKQIAFAWHGLLNETRGIFPRGIYMEFAFGGMQGTSSNGKPAYAGARPLVVPFASLQSEVAQYRGKKTGRR